MIAQATMSGADFDALPYEEGRQWELLEGELIEVPGTTPRHQKIVLRLSISLASYFEIQKIGDVYPDVEFALSENIRLRPDLAIILGEDWRGLDLDKTPVTVTPAIAVEVISPSERTANSNRKVHFYLQRGVQEVWQVFPINRNVLIYTVTSRVTALNGDDNLESALLPGWKMLVSDVLGPSLTSK